MGPLACPIISGTAVDPSSHITTKDLQKKKEVVEEVEKGRAAPADGNTNASLRLLGSLSLSLSLSAPPPCSLSVSLSK
uniref:Prothymosin alpha n=1 Tax=Lynx canadensis TaxID=61383 RepID=A0A667HED5_LYNCA